MDFAAWACGKKHGDQTERGDTGGNEHRAQPQHSALYHCELDVDSFAAQLVEVTNHDDAVEHRDAEKGYKADTGADAQIKMADDER